MALEGQVWWLEKGDVRRARVRGFVIRAEAYHLQSGAWAFEGVIVEPRPARPRHLRFYLDGITNSREAAVEMILAEGKRLIDYRSKPQGGELT